MNISIRTALLLGFFGAGSTLGACGGYVNLGDPFMAGAGGEGADTSEGTAGTTAGTRSGAGPTSGGAAGTGSDGSAGAPGGAPAAGGTYGGVIGEAGTGGGIAEGGTGGGDIAEGGTGGGGTAEGGAGEGDTGEGGTDDGGFAGAPPLGPREGSFKMLVYSRTEGFRHGSIAAGRKMIERIADQYDFDVIMTESNEEFTLEGLSKYEVLFFLNPTGDVFDGPHEQAFEAWMTTRNGAFVGMHSATDTERDWPFYKEVTGQYHDLHTNIKPGEITLEDAAKSFPGMETLPNPWPLNEEWYRFNSHEEWSTKPGFTILARYAENNHPVSFTREFANFRAFYTSLGHESAVYEDALVQNHVAGGILWAVRREHLYQE